MPDFRVTRERSWRTKTSETEIAFVTVRADCISDVKLKLEQLFYDDTTGRELEDSQPWGDPSVCHDCRDIDTYAHVTHVLAMNDGAFTGTPDFDLYKPKTEATIQERQWRETSKPSLIISLDKLSEILLATQKNWIEGRTGGLSLADSVYNALTYYATGED